MKAFYILELDGLFLALDVMAEHTSDEICQLQSQGFIVVSDNIRAKNSKIAIDKWRERCESFVEEPILTPLERANLTIRQANMRITDLKRQLSIAERDIESLNNQLRYKRSESDVGLCDLDILGYESEPSSQELRKRYKSLASLHHPDKGGSKAMMQRLNDAYEKLRRKVA
ncbi:J domain-containing protein [Vibrio sp. TRT 2004]|uniref:J domain-containing protein n=1 Tax=Vibrio sp. TRT 2004 TaxID=3418506 RepID=UPI003CFB83EF